MVEKVKILITGSQGMLGSALVKVLSSEFKTKGIDIADCDITDKDQIINLVTSYRPSIIIHTAAYTDVDVNELNSERAFAVNALGSENIAKAAKDAQALLFYISTDYVFDGNKPKPYIEEDIPNPVNIYGSSKLKGEKFVQALVEKHFILRTSWLFGPKGKNFVTTILDKAQAVSRLEVVDDQKGSPTYTLDLAKAIKNLIAHLDTVPCQDCYGIYHLTNAGSCFWFEFAKRIVELANLKTEVFPISSQESKRPACRPKMSILNTNKIKDVFSAELRTWQEALESFLSEFHEK